MCRLQLVEQCEDEELMDIVLPRLTKILSVWELLLAKVHICVHVLYCVYILCTCMVHIYCTVYMYCAYTVCTHSINIRRRGNLSSLGLGRFLVLPVRSSSVEPGCHLLHPSEFATFTNCIVDCVVNAGRGLRDVTHRFLKSHT